MARTSKPAPIPREIGKLITAQKNRVLSVAEKSLRTQLKNAKNYKRPETVERKITEARRNFDAEKTAIYEGRDTAKLAARIGRASKPSEFFDIINEEKKLSRAIRQIDEKREKVNAEKRKTETKARREFNPRFWYRTGGESGFDYVRRTHEITIYWQDKFREGISRAGYPGDFISDSNRKNIELETWLLPAFDAIPGFPFEGEVRDTVLGILAYQNGLYWPVKIEGYSVTRLVTNQSLEASEAGDTVTIADEYNREHEYTAVDIGDKLCVGCYWEPGTNSTVEIWEIVQDSP